MQRQDERTRPKIKAEQNEKNMVINRMKMKISIRTRNVTMNKRNERRDQYGEQEKNVEQKALHIRMK
jgi:hypothetical protein